ncbi:MAG: TIGR03560 family F420-dependent LLM class oxidoreductase [Anaerolineae bacterium]
MTQIGIMIEGQDGLTWARWQRLLSAAEDLGFQCVFRSDHYSNANPPDKESLELWVSLTYAATHTRHIEFGSLVAPVTFRHPALTTRMAAAVDDLSSGRLVLGLGAGWNEHEHKQFGVPFYDRKTRFEMFEDALEITTLLLDSESSVSYDGKHFSLDNAILLERPRRRTPVLIGGNGQNKTLGYVAKYAQEWNAVFSSPENVTANNAHLDELLTANGRQPQDVKRSLMHGVVYGHEDELEAKAEDLYGGTLDYVRGRGMFVGRGQELVDHIGRFVNAGVERFMLQWLDMDDLDGLDGLAHDVLPAFSS